MVGQEPKQEQEKQAPKEDAGKETTEEEKKVRKEQRQHHQQAEKEPGQKRDQRKLEHGTLKPTVPSVFSACSPWPRNQAGEHLRRPQVRASEFLRQYLAAARLQSACWA